jgi:hypothetical protein
MSLLVLLTLGVQRIGGMGNSVSDALAEKSQVRLAALSGVEIAYERLTTNAEYLGEQCTPLGDLSCAVDITVTNLGEAEYEVVSRSTMGESESAVRTRARVQPFTIDYPLSVGGSLRMYGDAKVMGDTFVSDILCARPHCVFVGNMNLEGERVITYDPNGVPIKIDGYPIPDISGEIYPNTEPVQFPTVTLDELRALAVSQGQLYTSTKHFTNKELTGVVYFEGTSTRPFFKDVTLKGVLVCDNVSEIRVESGFFKVRSDDDLCPNVAILAPSSNLWVDPHGELDVYGLTYIHETDFQGKATFTGPVMAVEDLYSRPDSHLYFQFPSYMKDFVSDFFEWSVLEVVETAYEEM